MNFLSVETATDVCSVSLFKNQKNFDTRTSTEPRSHSKNLGAFIRDIIQNNNLSLPELDFIAISSGPGSFTGLRIGFSLVKGLIFPFELPVVLVPTLQSLEAKIKDEGSHHIAIHSHSNIVYVQEYSNGSPVSKIHAVSINEIKYKKLYGYGLKNRYFSVEYVEIIPSSELVGLTAMEHKENWLEYDFEKITPNYVSHFNLRKK